MKRARHISVVGMPAMSVDRALSRGEGAVMLAAAVLCTIALVCYLAWQLTART